MKLRRRHKKTTWNKNDTWISYHSCSYITCDLGLSLSVDRIVLRNRFIRKGLRK